jgi:S1-C subfamily serine protease
MMRVKLLPLLALSIIASATNIAAAAPPPHRALSAPTTAPASRPSTAPTTVPSTRPAARERLGVALIHANKQTDGAELVRSLGGGGNLIVGQIMRGSRSERLAMRAGDVVRRINGKAMSTTTDVLDAVHGWRS